MTIEQIQSGRITLLPGRISLQRAQELSWATAIIEKPLRIVPNWQALGSANPGDAYLRDFGVAGKPVYKCVDLRSLWA
jgi:hypothetical protein